MPYKGEPYNQEYYKGTRDEGYSDYSSVEWVQRKVADDIEDLFSSVNGLRILDIGCAFGYLVDELASRGATVTGIDISSYAIGKANALFPDRDFVNVDFFDNTFDDDTFDLIVSCGFVDCLQNKQKIMNAVTEVKRILKPQGKVYILASLRGVESYYTLLNEQEWQDGMQTKFQGRTITITDVGHLPVGWDVRITVD